MHSFRVSVLMLFMAFILTGCEHYHDAVNSFKADDEHDRDSSYSTGFKRTQVYGDTNVITSTNPSVKIYNLDSAQTQNVQTQTPVQNFNQPIGRAVDGNPGVTIFSVDDEWNTQPPAEPVRPSLAPPSQYREGMPSPFNQGSLVNPTTAKTIYFAHGSSYVNSEGKKVVRTVADNYNDGRYGVINVVGHASKRAETSDPVQRSLVNMQMSMKRAMSVSEGLIKNGIPSDSIKASAFGDTKPAMNLNGKSQETANRRVEIKTAGVFTPAYRTTQVISEDSARQFPAGGPVTLLPLN